MHFPSDRDTTNTPTHPGRRIHMGPVTAGDDVFSLTADPGEVVFQPNADPTARAVSASLMWHEGAVLVRLDLDELQAFVPLVEQRLALNATLLEDLSARLEAQETLVENNRAKLAAARAAVAQVVRDDRTWMEARGGRFKSGDMIINTFDVIAPEVYIRHRQCLLRETQEWQRAALLESRTKSRSAPEALAVQERDRLQWLLAEERKMTSTLQSRLYDLRQKIAWWEQQGAGLLP